MAAPHAELHPASMHAPPKGDRLIRGAVPHRVHRIPPSPRVRRARARTGGGVPLRVRGVQPDAGGGAQLFGAVQRHGELHVLRARGEARPLRHRHPRATVRRVDDGPGVLV